MAARTIATIVEELRHECIQSIQKQLMEDGDVIYDADSEQAIGLLEAKVVNVIVSSGDKLDDVDRVWYDVADLMVRVALRRQFQDANTPSINPIALPVLRLTKILCTLYQTYFSHGGTDQPTNVDRWAATMIHACSFYLSSAPYTSTECQASCQEIMEVLPVLLRHRSRAFQSSDDLFSRYFTRVLSMFASKSSKEEWIATQSAAPYAFRWMVRHVMFPHFENEVIGRIFALALPLLDQVTVSTQVIGLDVVHHVVRQATATDIRWYTDILLHEMQQTLVTASSSPDFLRATLDCLSDTLAVVSVQGDVQHYDRFFPSLLRQWDMSLEVPVKQAMTVGIRPWIQAMGAPHSLQLLRYLQPLIKVTLGCLESTPLQREGLETLRLVVLAAWIRMPHHVEEITLGLLKCLAYQSMQGSALRVKRNKPTDNTEDDDVIPRCHHILNLLQDDHRRSLQSAMRRSRA
ncbi:hypothetical protein AC1031_013381 [Aphanomyces cochlioides]|nr:hypothetical protein AC1031_013381 [Aphanomyces cochlioides]